MRGASCSAATIASESAQALSWVGVDAESLVQGPDGIIRCEIRVDEKDLDGPLVAMPWESLIAEATRNRRGGRPPVVTRGVIGSSEPPARGDFALLVVSEPGQLSGKYSFTSEIQFLKRAIKLNVQEPLRTPTLEQLTSACKDHPTAVHISGFDTEQAEMLGIPELTPHDASSPKLYLNSTSGPPEAVDPKKLAVAVGKAGVVTFNFYNSGGEFCAQAIRNGSDYAVGIQDTIDDSTAESFFYAFYHALGKGPSPKNDGMVVRTAFEFALEAARTSKGLRGTGICLWHRVL